MNIFSKYFVLTIYISCLLSDNYIIDIDATSYTDWVYFNVSIGSEVIIDNPENSLGWDLAFQRYHIRTNSGTSGSGNGGAFVDSVNLWSAELFNSTSEIQLYAQFNEDTLSESFYDEITHTFTWGSTSPTLETWGEIDTSNNYNMEISNNQLIVRTADGNNFIKFWPFDYYDDNGNSGHLTILYGTDINCTYGMDECGVCGGENDICLLPGDINGDHNLDIQDIIMLVDIIISENLESYDYNILDINGDLNIDILDVVSLLIQMLGY